VSPLSQAAQSIPDSEPSQIASQKPPPNAAALSHAPEPSLYAFDVLNLADASIERNKVISHAATGWRIKAPDLVTAPA
jgi:hypothetical protein